MTEQEVVEFLVNGAYDLADANDLNVDAQSFEEVGLLSDNEGFVIVVDNKKFQVTVVAV